MSDEVILRFNQVSFQFSETKPILEEANLSVRRGSKITLMGQNGAGKSTLFGLLTGKFKPKAGLISLNNGMTIGYAKQTLAQDELDLTVREYFERAFEETMYNLDVHIKQVLNAVNLSLTDYDRIMKSFSGGQQARLLLAYALVADPDLLLLDEPTNNLDQDGIEHLTGYLMMYDKTVLVISHDEVFLNAFSDGVLYLDIHTHQVEQYTGNYFDAVQEIGARIDRENRQNARMEKEIEDRKEKINFFANKGGKMRKLASKLRDQVSDAEENKVEVRREDRTIRDFDIPLQENLSGALITLPNATLLDHGDPVTKTINLELRKNTHLLLKGPNGIGKSTLLQSIVDGTVAGMELMPDLVIGYYRQDFANLDFGKTVRESLIPDPTIPGHEEQRIRSVAAGFLIDSKIINTRIGDLSEGQKGLVALTHLVLKQPGLLILDEPTNHINFRHLPIIAKALDEYEGAMILVSHVPDFVEQIRIDQTLDLKKVMSN